MLFGGRQRAVHKLLADYVEQAERTVSLLAEGLEIWLGGAESLDRALERTHHVESQADDVRRELCMLLYGKALFPESRGDILGLVEAVDKIPNRSEAIIRRIKSEHIPPPAGDLPAGVLKLCGLVSECTREMFKGVRVLFTNHHAAVEITNQVDELESQADLVEMELIEQVFTSNIDGFSKILYRDVIMDIGGLADRAEDVSDRMRIIAVKRKA